MGRYSPIIALFAALAMSPIVPAIHIILMRLFKKNERAIFFMLVSFVIYGLLWLGSVFFMNNFIPISPSSIVAGISLIAFISLGYDEFFLMACGGFSLQIIVDIYLHGSMTLTQVISNYSEKGMGWMIGKRIETMKSLGMVKLNGETLEIASLTAVFIGKTGLLIKEILKIGKGG